MNQYFKTVTIILLMAISAKTSTGQETVNKSPNYKVVFQLSSNDTLVHKSFIKQMNNLLIAMENVTIEVVTHGPGLELLFRDSKFIKDIELLNKRGIWFLACRNTLREKKIDPQKLSPLAEIIPAGIAHVIRRQSEGWSYIKVGF